MNCKKTNFIIKLVCVLFVFFLSFPCCYATPKSTAEKLDIAIENIISYKKSQSNGYIINSDVLENVFDFSDAKLVVALSQGGFSDNYNNYSAVLNNFISDKYSTNEKLYSLPAATGAQMSLAMLACNANPYTIKGANGKSYDFLADNIYNRDTAYSLGKNGLEGYAWGLIALDAYNYDYDVDILKFREDIMAKIVDSQLPDGTYTSTDSTSPYYLSALSILALAKDYNNERRKYEIREQTIELKKELDKKRKEEGIKVTFEEFEKEYGIEDEPTLYHYVDMCIDKSLSVLSKKQSDDGSYKAYSKSNIKTTSAVITALCTLGINPDEDARFIKHGNNLLDGLLKYQQKDGSFKVDENSDVTAETTDALCALISFKRFLNNQKPLYDFSDKVIYQTDGMLQVSVKDIENIKYINENFSLSLYPQVCMIYEKVLQSDRKDKIFLLSLITSIKEKKFQNESIIRYINEQGSELLYSENGVKLNKKRQIRELLKLCESISQSEQKYIYVYEDLVLNTKRIENALALETLLFCVVLIVIVSFFLSILMYLIKKRTLVRKTFEYNMEVMNQKRPTSSKNNISAGAENKKMPFEIEEAFFEYEIQETQPLEEVVNNPLPFEDEDEFFDYEMPHEEQFAKETAPVFPLPFEMEEENDFFDYEIEDNNVTKEEVKKEDKDMMPFEKETGFFKYR